MDKKEELKGLLKETIQDEMGDKISELEAKAAKLEEDNAKMLETNTALKAEFDAAQDKTFKLLQNTGSNLYTFKGYNVNTPWRNYRPVCDKEIRDEAAGAILKALTSANTGAYAIPVEYSDALLGLAELSSVALSKMRVYNTGTNSLKIPIKGTRATVDAQAFGTANTATSTTLGQLTFTIDKRVGGYESIYNDVLSDQMFDVVGEFVEPVIAEAIGQAFDGEVIKKTEFTTDIAAGGTAGVTVSGAANMATAITYANLVTIAYAVELERGLSPEWFMPRGAMKDVVALVGSSNDHPIFSPVPVSGAPRGTLLGYPVNIMPAMDNTPDSGDIRIAFGDPKQYIIAVNGGLVFQINPYVQMKEAITQFIGYARADGNIVSSAAFATLKRTDA